MRIELIGLATDRGDQSAAFTTRGVTTLVVHVDLTAAAARRQGREQQSTSTPSRVRSGVVRVIRLMPFVRPAGSLFPIRAAFTIMKTPSL